MKTILSAIAILVTGVALGAGFMKLFAPPPAEPAPAALVQAVAEVDKTPPPMSELCGRIQELSDLKVSDATLDEEYARSCLPPEIARPYVDLAAAARQQVCNDQRKLAEAGDAMGKPLYEMMVAKGDCK